MTFYKPHFQRCKAQSDGVINIVRTIKNPNGSCMACDELATVIRHIEYPYYEIDAPLCDSCAILLKGELEVMMFKRFGRKVDK